MVAAWEQDVAASVQPAVLSDTLNPAAPAFKPRIRNVGGLLAPGASTFTVSFHAPRRNGRACIVVEWLPLEEKYRVRLGSGRMLKLSTHNLDGGAPLAGGALCDDFSADTGAPRNALPGDCVADSSEYEEEPTCDDSSTTTQLQQTRARSSMDAAAGVVQAEPLQTIGDA